MAQQLNQPLQEPSLPLRLPPLNLNPLPRLPSPNRSQNRSQNQNQNRNQNRNLKPLTPVQKRGHGDQNVDLAGC